LSDRSEYFKKYYQEHKASLAAYYKERYEQDKNKVLTKSRTYYILNRTMILIKAKLKSTGKADHAYDIWRAITKYAKKWGIPWVPWNEFKAWAMNDEGYDTIYKQWKDEGFSRVFSPVAMRNVKKNGFIPENLKWSYREQYSWWSTEMEDFKKQEEDLNQKQLERNKRDKAWRKRIRDEWKAKRKKI
jgi:hypothetical protein